MSITALEGDLAADVSGLAAGLTTSAALVSTGDVELAAAANLTNVDTVNITGTGTVTANASATLGSGTYDVGTDATLSLTAVHADGLTATGDGTVSITGDFASQDLTSIANTVTVSLDGGTAAVANGATLSIKAVHTDGLTLTGDGTVDISGDVIANTDLTDITSTISFDTTNTVSITGGTLTLTGDQADQIAGGVTKSGDGAITVTVESVAENLTQKVLTDVDTIEVTAGNSANLTVSQVTTLTVSNISGDYVIVDTVSAIVAADADVMAGAVSYIVVSTASSIKARIDLEGVGAGTIVGDASSIDASDDAAVDLTVIQANSKGSIFVDGFNLTDTASALLGEVSSLVTTTTNAGNDIKVAAGAAGQLSVAQYNTLIGVTTVDTWTYSIQDSASALLVVGTAEPLTSATAVSVTNNAAGALTVSEMSSLLSLTEPSDNDGWSYSIDDDPTAIATELNNNGDANSYILGDATSVTVTGTVGDDDFSLSLATIDLVIDAGAGVDIVTGGSGNDTIDLGSSDGVADTYVFAATDTSNGQDVVTNFEGGTDILDVQSFETAGKFELTGNPDVTTADGIVYFVSTGTAGAADAGQSVGASFVLNNSANWTDSDSSTAWFVLADNNSTAVYEFNDTAAAAGVQASELTLLATFDGIVSFDDILVSS